MTLTDLSSLHAVLLHTAALYTVHTSAVPPDSKHPP